MGGWNILKVVGFITGPGADAGAWVSGDVGGWVSCGFCFAYADVPKMAVFGYPNEADIGLRDSLAGALEPMNLVGGAGTSCCEP